MIYLQYFFHKFLKYQFVLNLVFIFYTNLNYLIKIVHFLFLIKKIMN